MNLFMILMNSLVLGCLSLTNKRVVRLCVSSQMNSELSSAPTDLEYFIKKLIMAKSVQDIRYSSSPEYGGHISYEYFPYEQRYSESDYIVSSFRGRQDKRLNATDPIDKSCNPLIALPGSPGSGKSTFMVHFPEYPSYLDYVKDADLVLVTTLTFNSGMDYGTTALGLRIVFGLLKSMGLLQQYPSLLRWRRFYSHFIAYESLKGADSIDLITSIFAERYPDAKIRFLILIDELSKSRGLDSINGELNIFTTLITLCISLLKRLLNADEPNILMKDIGRILNEFGNVDVLISSLSPTFIDKLLTGSQRSIEYVIPKPLLGYPIGTFYYDQWVSRLCNMSNLPEKDIDETKFKIIKHFYLLYSGHPRSLEYFCEVCCNTRIEWKNIIDSLLIRGNTRPTQSYYEFLKVLIKAVSNRSKKFVMNGYSEEDAQYLSKYVFSTVPVSSEDNIARELLECNKLMLYKTDGRRFIFMVQTVELLKWLDRYRSGNLESIKLQKIQLLVQEFENLSISELWEYIIAISIISHSYDYDKLQSVFGFSQYRGRFRDYPCLNVMFDKDSKVLSSIGLTPTEKHVDTREVERLITPNTLHMAASRQSGFDLRVVMNNVDEYKTNHIYIQCKIGMPMKSLSNTLAGIIYYSVRHYIDVIQGTDLGELHIGLYIWADIDKDTLSTVDKMSILDEIKNGMIISEVPDDKEHIEILKKEGGSDDSTVNTVKEYEQALINKILSYINLHFDHIHILDKKGIEDWLLPSFLSIPYFIQDVNE